MKDPSSTRRSARCSATGFPRAKDEVDNVIDIFAVLHLGEDGRAALSGEQKLSEGGEDVTFKVEERNETLSVETEA